MLVRSLLFACTLSALAFSLGCGKKPDKADTDDVPVVSTNEKPMPAVQESPSGTKVVANVAIENVGKTENKDPVSAEPAPIKRDRLHQAFADAVRSSEDPPPADAVRPPDETVTKKPCHRFLDIVKNSWDNIRFVTSEGKKIEYSAKIETSMGTLAVRLYPEQAPNHVRNFIALARGGYYDELFFERIRKEKNPTTGQELQLIEGGCPLGTGATGTGSVGYWLKGEFTPKEKMAHSEGIFGACRGEEADSAATRFYITLNQPSFMDGNYTIFGKVETGLDILRKIGLQPVIIDEEGNRPVTPIVIKSVTITEKVVN
jgi:cyclophilin family peptidyl-prolyl cis-trans isomerase